MIGVECNLFCLRKVFIDSLVEFKFINVVNRDEFFRLDFGSVEDVKVEVVFFGFGDCLNVKFLFWECVVLNSFFKIFLVEIRVLISQFESFILDKGVYIEVWCLVEFDEVVFVFIVDKCEGVDIKVLYYLV